MEINNILKSEEENLNNKNSSEQIKTMKIVNTPFTIIGNDELGYAIATPRHKLTKHIKPDTYFTTNACNTETELDEMARRILDDYMWNVIANLIAVFWDQVNTKPETNKT